MLTYLDILNGELSPSYHEYNTLYTVNVDSDVQELEMKYFVDEKYTVNVINNKNLLVGENIININVLENDEIVEQYILLVNKEEVSTVFNEVVLTPEVNPSSSQMEKLPDYVIPLMIIFVLILILLMFKVLFPRKKRLKNR